MEIELPKSGCNVFYGNYIDNYDNTIRTRYYIHNGELIPNEIDENASMPTGLICADTLSYRPELSIYFEGISILILLFVAFLIYRVIIKRLLP